MPSNDSKRPDCKRPGPKQPDCKQPGWKRTASRPSLRSSSRPSPRAAAALLSLLSLAAVPLLAQTTIRLDDASLLAKGNDLFSRNCATGYCHGAEGRAARGPDLRNREWDAYKLHTSIRDGLPGTSMPPWNGVLAAEDLWALTAYIIHLGPAKAGSASVTIGARLPAPAQLTAEARRGHDLFFDLNNQKRCAICHRLAGKGTAIGPDLWASARAKSASQLTDDILHPAASVAEGFQQTVVTTSQGETLAGVKHSETEELVRLYDAEAIPPPLRTFYKDQIRGVEIREQSSMPADYEKIYSRDQLRAIVAYLKSATR